MPACSFSLRRPEGEGLKSRKPRAQRVEIGGRATHGTGWPQGHAGFIACRPFWRGAILRSSPSIPPMDTIRIRGARTHNLKNIDLDLPRDQLIVITGLSGSGKSSLAFDTIYAEGQRRYVESLSSYARQFLS